MADLAGDFFRRPGEKIGFLDLAPAALDLARIDVAEAGMRAVHVAVEGFRRVLPEARQDRARLDQRHPDAGAAQFDAQGVGEGFQRELGGAIAADHGRGDAAEHRSNVDDAAAALAPERRQQRAGQLVQAEHVGLELGAQGRAGHVLEGAGLAIARVVDERAERAVRAREGFGRGGIDGSGIGEIQRDGFEPLRAQGVEIGGGARGGEDPPTGDAQRLGRGGADAGRAAGDQDRAGWNGGNAHAGASSPRGPRTSRRERGHGR